MIVVIGLIGLAALCWWAAAGAKKQRTSLEQSIASIPDFSVGMRYNDPWKASVIAIDPGSGQFAYGGVERPFRTFPFGALIAVEVERDGVTIEKTNRGSQAMGAALGGALLGPAGLLMGGLSGSKTHRKGKDTRLSLKLVVNDLQAPSIEIVFLAPGIRKMVDHKEKLIGTPEERLAEWFGRFRVILHGQQNGPSAPASAASGSLQPPAGFGRRRGLLASD